MNLDKDLYMNGIIENDEAFLGENRKEAVPMEYGDISKMINEKYGLTMNSQQVQREFRKAFNIIFAKMVSETPDQLFEIMKVMVDEFNISEDKIVRYLDEENLHMARSFAKANFETKYYEKKEREMLKVKAEKRGEFVPDRVDVMDLFE